MAVTTIQWNEGDGSITATYEGSGNGALVLESDVNEGIDREQSIVVTSADGLTESVLIRQSGRREVFEVTEGAFEVAEGTFNVLKEE